jgi:hypothetical protein
VNSLPVRRTASGFIAPVSKTRSPNQIPFIPPFTVAAWLDLVENDAQANKLSASHLDESEK